MDPKLRRGQTDMDTVRQRVAAGAFWTVNGRGRLDLLAEPDLKLSSGESAIITLRNDTAFQHPMHLHGHHFRVVSRNSSPAANPPWLDTVVVDPGEELELAFVAGRPGRWLFHCHVPSHMRTGMAAVVAVA
jgi:FtsP/CotA-like multicopper oxidase with cupredoxin domain